jgi:hypothetical protein
MGEFIGMSASVLNKADLKWMLECRFKEAFVNVYLDRSVDPAGSVAFYGNPHLSRGYASRHRSLKKKLAYRIRVAWKDKT